MLSALTPDRSARLLLTAARNVGTLRGLARRPESPIHAAADAHRAAFAVAIRYAFAMGRRALGKTTPNADAAASAVRSALEVTLKPTLLKVVAAGGEAGLALLKKRLRVAEFNPDQPRDENGQWTASGLPISVKEHKSGTVTFEVNDTRSKMQPGESPFSGLDVSTTSIPGYLTVGDVAVTESSQRQGIASNLYKRALDYSEEHGYKGIASIANHRKEDGDQLWKSLHKVGEVTRGVPVKDANGQLHFIDVLTKRLRVAGDVEELRTAKDTAKPSFNVRFDAKNQAVIDWADRHSAELIDGITETTRETINNAIADLQETGDWADAYDEILGAVGDEARADLIARHETMLAAGEGQRLGWDQAVDAGLLTGDEQRVWIVTPDEKLCPVCEGLEDKNAKLGESYIGDDGNEYDGPPAHVQCRCTEGIA